MNLKYCKHNNNLNMITYSVFFYKSKFIDLSLSLTKISLLCNQTSKGLIFFFTFQAKQNI